MTIYHDQDWENKHSKKKHYQKQEQQMHGYPEAKPYHKPKQYPKPQQQWHQGELPLDWSAQPLTDTEIEELFWGKLVQLGWRLQTYGESLKSKNIVLPCYECNKILDSYSWVSITKTNAIKMSDDKKVKEKVESHGGFECKAIPEVTPEA